MEKLHVHLHRIFLNLLKAGPNVKHKTLLWLGKCLEKNSGRCKLWNVETAMLEFVSDGFAVNLSAVFLRLCQPFISNTDNPKLLKIDPTYCAAKVNIMYKLLIDIINDDFNIYVYRFTLLLIVELVEYIYLN